MSLLLAPNTYFGDKIRTVHFRRTWDLRILRLSRTFYALQLWGCWGVLQSGDGTLTSCFSPSILYVSIYVEPIGKTFWVAKEILYCWYFLEFNLSCHSTYSIRNVGGFFLLVGHSIEESLIFCSLFPRA